MFYKDWKILNLLSFVLINSLIFVVNKDYTSLFKDTTYKNYWARYWTLIKLCKNPDKNYKLLLLAYQHPEPPISELAGNCLTKLKKKKNIDDFISNFIDKEKNDGKLKNHIRVLFQLSHTILIKKINGKILSANLKAYAIELLENQPLKEEEISSIKQYLKDKDSRVKLSALKVLINNNSISEEDLVNLSSQANKDLELQLLRAKCKLNQEECIKIIEKKIKTNDNLEFCKLINVIKEYQLHQTLKSLLSQFEKSKDVFRKKAVFSALGILEEEDFKKEILKNWRELSVNFLSLLFNLYLVKYQKEDISLEELYKEISKQEGENRFTTVSIPTFLSVPIYGKTIIFVIDTSGSMAKKIKGSNKTRFEVAKEELENVLTKLGINVKFNIVLINSETDKLGIRTLFKSPAGANAENIKKAKEYLTKAWETIQKVKRGRTDIFDALEIALKQSEIDTIILLTDGNPTWGKYTLYQNIVREISKINECKFISINSIATGSTEFGKNFLKNLSLSNWGVFKEAKWGK